MEQPVLLPNQPFLYLIPSNLGNPSQNKQPLLNVFIPFHATYGYPSQNWQPLLYLFHALHDVMLCAILPFCYLPLLVHNPSCNPSHNKQPLPYVIISSHIIHGNPSQNKQPLPSLKIPSYTSKIPLYT